jgi:splicing factor 3B subunit 4
MNGQYLGGKPISISYAFKKDGQKGERHGSTAERKLADLGKKNNVIVNGFLPPAIGSLPPLPIPQGFQQVGQVPLGAGPPGPPPLPQFGGPPPGFGGVGVPGQGPPPGMPPPPGFNQFGR